MRLLSDNLSPPNANVQNRKESKSNSVVKKRKTIPSTSKGVIKNLSKNTSFLKRAVSVGSFGTPLASIKKNDRLYNELTNGLKHSFRTHLLVLGDFKVGWRERSK